MLYQLPNGKCIELSVEQYLRMSDEELADIFASNFGGHIHDPFALSVLKYGSITPDEIEIDDYAEEEIETLVDVDPEEKLIDDDFIDEDNIEV